MNHYRRERTRLIALERATEKQRKKVDALRIHYRLNRHAVHACNRRQRWAKISIICLVVICVTRAIWLAVRLSGLV